MKNLALFLLLVPLASMVFAANEGNVYSFPIVKRLGIREPPISKFDLSYAYGSFSHERRLALFLDKQCARHRQMTLTLNEFFLSHPHFPLSVASFAVSNLNAVLTSTAFVKLSKSKHNLLMAPDRQRFCQQLERDLDRCYQDLSFFRDYDSNHPLSANPSIYSPAERRLAQAGTQAPFADPIVANPIPSSTVRRKKKNWSFVELQSGVDFDADAQRQQEYEQQIAARQAYSRQRDDAQFQLQEAERQRWFAEQQRIQAEQSARDNRIPSFQGGLDSQAEISRQQEMWAEQQKRDAEMRAHLFP